MTPFFSVIIPLYNKERFIKETLDSVISQTFTNFEVIIVNDGSTDNSVKIVETFTDNRIKLYHQENQGLSHTRNNAIGHAKANYMAFIDADDFWLEHHLEQLHQLILDFPNRGLYGTAYTMKKAEKTFHRANFYGINSDFRGVILDFFRHSKQHCLTWVGAMCIPKTTFESVGYFDPEIYSEQDIDLYIRIALKHKFVLDNTSVSSIYNRTMDDNMSNFSEKVAIPKFLNSYKNLEKTNPFLNRYIDLNRFSTVVFFKLSNNKVLENELKKDISSKNLTTFQILILKMPNSLVRFLFGIKERFNLNPFIVFKSN